MVMLLIFYIDRLCWHSAYIDLDIKKPLRINAPKWLFYLVGPPRLELGTNGLWVRCSNQLSYRPFIKWNDLISITWNVCNTNQNFREYQVFSSSRRIVDQRKYYDILVVIATNCDFIYVITKSKANKVIYWSIRA